MSEARSDRSARCPLFACIVGLSPTGLYAMRECADAGIPVAGVAEGLQCASASRALSVTPVLALDSDHPRLVRELLALAERVGTRGLLVPTSDNAIEFVAENGPALAASYDFPRIYEGIRHRQLVDKGRLLTACEAAGIAVPRSREAVAGAIVDAGRSMAFPLLLKPTLVHRVKRFMAGRKVLVAPDLRALEAIAGAIPPGLETDWLVQEIVPGPDSAITLFSGYRDREGIVRQPFTARKLRQYPPGFGSASLVQAQTLAETGDAATALLEALDFQGIAGVEFKTDPTDGTLKLIEINPRPSLWFAVGTAAGKRATLAAWRDFAGLVPLPETAQLDGVVWRYGLKDHAAAAWYRLKGRDFVLPAPDCRSALAEKRKVNALFDRRDPAPALRELANYARKAAGRMLGPRTGAQ